ncbi:DUF378 domain-containing protein [Candidatus Dependentiae bacterium]|nr:DUF378 domain-containing protein [Candidatus Dependentiae bacterium]
MKNVVRSIAVLLAIIASVNWGLVGLFDFNLIKTITPGMPMLERFIYVAAGLAGLLLAYYEIEGCKCSGNNCR